MIGPDSALLRVEGLSRLYGRGCDACLDLTGPERGGNVCPDCGTIVACADV